MTRENHFPRHLRLALIILSDIFIGAVKEFFVMM